MDLAQLNRTKNWFRVETNFNTVFALLAAFITFWKGFRLPYDWAATQAQFDYRFGIVRLGLFGEICHLLHLKIIDYRVFSLVSLTLLCLFLTLLIRTAIRSGLASPFHGLFIVLIASSYCLSFTINVVGYFDVTLAILVLLALSVQGYRWQLFAVTLAAMLGCLVHELYLVAFLPLSLINLLRRAEEQGFRLRFVFPPIALIIIPTLLVLKLCGHLALTTQQMHAFSQDWHAHANFPVRDDFFLVLKKPLSQCFAESRQYFRAGEWWLEELICGAAFFPAAAYFLFLSFRFLPAKLKWTRRYIILAVICPMALNLIAVDFMRWINFVGLNALFAAVASARSLDREEGTPVPRSPFGILARNTALLLIAVNLASNVGTFLPGADYPFLEHWRHFRENRLLHRPILAHHVSTDYTF